jgi:SAM-dependent methyltransferase
LTRTVHIGQERHFNALLSKKVDPELLDRVRKEVPRSVLDVGAFSGEALCLLHHWFPSFTHLEGWETSRAEKVLAMVRNTDRVRMPHAQYRSLYERYCLHVNEMGLPGWKRIATEDDYKRIIKLRYETDPASARPFIDSYDLIIMSNVLHTFDTDTLDKLIHKLEGVHPAGSLAYVHTKSRPLEGFMPGNSSERVTKVCERLAERWSLRSVIGLNDHEGQHVTYTNL